MNKRVVVFGGVGTVMPPMPGHGEHSVCVAMDNGDHRHLLTNVAEALLVVVARNSAEGEAAARKAMAAKFNGGC